MKKFFTVSKTILLMTIFICMGVGININKVYSARPTKPRPTLEVTPSELTDFKYIEGFGPSDIKFFKVSGKNINGIMLSFELGEEQISNYEFVSKEGEVFTPIEEGNIWFPADETGTVAEKTVYVRLKKGLNVGDYPLEIKAEGESKYFEGEYVVKYVNLQGAVNPAPTLTVTPEALSGLNYKYNEGPSEVKSFTVEATEVRYTILDLGLNDDNPESYYEFSYSSPDSEDGFQPIDFSQGPVHIQTSEQSFETTIYVRLKEGLPKGEYPQTVTIVGTSIYDENVTITKTVSFTGEVTEEPNAISITSADSFRIFTADGQVVIENASADSTIEVYNVLGKKVAEQPAVEGRNQIALSEKGLLIVKVGNRTKKVIVR